MNKERFEQFKANESWAERFVWRGLYNDAFRSDLSVLKFLNNETPFKDVNVNNINKFWKIVDSIKDDYVKWCFVKDCSLTDEEKTKIGWFFVGCIGEYFFYKLFEIHPTLYINNKLYTFSYVCPRLEGEVDYGVDMTGKVSSNEKNSRNCVFQVKFWNPYIDDYDMTYGILAKTGQDATDNNFIDNSETENIFVCWLNNEDKVTKSLKNNEKFWKRLVFIGKKVLDDNINNKIPEFWNIFFDHLNRIQ